MSNASTNVTTKKLDQDTAKINDLDTSLNSKIKKVKNDY